MKKGILFQLFLLAVLVRFSDGQSRFQTLIGGTPYNTNGYRIANTLDGGFALTGSSSQPATWHNALVAKLDSASNLQWIHNFGDSLFQKGCDIIQTSDGGYAIAGRSNSVGPFLGSANGYVLKLGVSGNLQWSVTIGGYESDEFNSVVQTFDGDLVVAGYSNTFCFGLGTADFYVTKLDILTGSILWTKNIGGSGYDAGMDMVETADSGLVIAGYTGSFGQGNNDIYCVKLSSTGNLLWTTTIGGADWDWGCGITKTIDGGFAIAGYTSSYGAGGNDFYIVKINGNGVLQWTRTVGGIGNDGAYDIVQASNGNYVIAGYSDSFSSNGDSDYYLVSLDSNGNLLWTRNIGGSSIDGAGGITIADDGGYVINGTSLSFNSFASGSIYIVKTDSDGYSCSNQLPSGGTVSSGGTSSSGGVTGFGGSFIYGTIINPAGTTFSVCNMTGINESISNNLDIKITPNPTSGILSISLIGGMGVSDFQIYDSFGKKVFSGNLYAEAQNTFDISALKAGVYYIKALDKEKFFSKKIVLLQD